MLKGKISRLYIQIIACLLCVVLFSGAIVFFVSTWFTREYESSFLEQNRSAIEGINGQMADNLQSIYDACAMIMSNQIIKDNLRPYSTLTPDQTYNYNSIISLLQQARFQFNGLVDGIFLYTDTQKVLYAQKLSGMADFSTFFKKFLMYNSHSTDFWQELLQNPGTNLSVLSPDVCKSIYVNDVKVVVPLIYTVPGTASTQVLAINIALSRVVDQFYLKGLYPGTLYAICDSDGRLLLSSPALQDFSFSDPGEKLRINGQNYYVFTAAQKALNIQTYILVPVSALSNLTSYYRTVMISLLAVLLIFGGVLAVIMSNRAYAPLRIVREDIKNLPVETPPSSIRNEIELIRSTLSQLTDERELYKTRDLQHSYYYLAQSIAALLERRPLNDIPYFNLLLTREYGFSGHCFLCAAAVIDMEEDDNYMLWSDLTSQLRSRLTATLHPSFPTLCFAYQHNMLVLLCGTDENGRQTLQAALQDAIQSFSSTCTLRVGVGRPVRDAQDLPLSFEAACTEIFSQQPGKEMLQISPQEIFSYDPAEIRSAAATGDIREIEEIACSILTQAKQCRIPYRDAANILKDIMHVAIETQHKYSRQTDFLPRTDNINPLEVLILHPEINIVPLTVTLLPHMIDRTGDTEKNSGKIALQIRDYIDKHYAEEMSLDILADKIDISPKYLSRVFKQVMGVNLSDYLTYIRVEKIKEMLLTDMPLGQIAEQVGIFNRTTFTRMFKRLEGVTPSEYRSLHRPV